MKRIVSILLSVCFVAMPMFLSGGSLHAMVEASELEALRQQNEQLKLLVEDLRQQLEQLKLQTESQTLRTINELKGKSGDLSSAQRLQESLVTKAQQELKAKEEYLKTLDVLKAKEEFLRALDMLEDRVGMAEDRELQAQVEEKLKAAALAMEKARNALEDADVTEKMEEFLRQFPDSEKAKKMLEDYKRAKEKQAESKAKLALAMRQYEMALRQTTPEGLSNLLRGRMLAQLAKRGYISQKAAELEDYILSKDDMGLLTQLRFEKVDLCRKLGKIDDAVDQLEEIIEESPDEKVQTSARWMLIEILQEAGKTEDAMDELKDMLSATKDPKVRRSILYAIIQMAGDDPEARLRVTEEVIESLEENVREAQEEAREKQGRVQCATNLKQLVLAMTMWSQDHNDEFPEKLSVLYPDYMERLDGFTCPSAEGPRISKREEIDSGTSYICRRPPTDTPPADEVVLYEDPSNHAGEGGHVAFADGHVKWFSAQELMKLVERGREVGL